MSPLRQSVTFAAILGVLFMPFLAEAQWVSRNGLPVGAVNAFIAVGPTVFAGTGAGVLKSTDGGMTWTNASEGLPGAVRHLASGNGRLFAAADHPDEQQQAVYSSSDSGRSWILAADSLSDLVFDLLARGSSVFVSTYSGGIFRSTDNGASWKNSNTGFPPRIFLRFLGANTQYIFAANDARGVYRSSDDGSTWSRPDSTWTFSSLNALLVNGTDLYLSANAANPVFGGVLLRSTDSGTSWVRVGSGLPPESAGALAVADSFLFAKTLVNGMFRSSDKGMTWTGESNGLTTMQLDNAIVAAPGVLIACKRSVIFRSTDHGEFWSLFNLSLGVPAVTALATWAPWLIIGTSNNGILRSSDSGVNWFGTGLEYDGCAVYTLAIIDSNLYAGTSWGVYRSPDGGSTWTQYNNGITGVIVSFGKRGNTLFGGSGSGWGYYASTDGGGTWIHSLALGYGNVNAWMTGDSTLMAGTSNVGFATSTNNGTTWSQLNTYLPGAVSALTRMGAFLYAGTVRGVYRRDDSEPYWEDVNELEMQSMSINSLLNVSPTNLFAGASGGGVFLTHNGTGWKTFNSGLTSASVYRLAVIRSNLYAGTAAGVFSRPLSEMITGVAATMTGLPDAFKLEQNYPNPFNPTTTIRYALPRRAVVILTVYNTLGQQAAALVNEVQEAGFHDARFDGSGLASGVYFYRLRAGDYVSTKELVILR